MGARNVEELHAYRAARELKLEIYRIVRGHPEAFRDLKFRGQLYDALMSNESNVAEGFRRFKHREFAHYLSYALSSLEEARRRLQDGIDRGYFVADECQQAFELAERAKALTSALATYLRGGPGPDESPPPKRPPKPKK